MLEGLVVDNFAGGGGASTGIEAAIGRPIDIAINHDAEAVAMHAINHPATRHYCQSVWKVDPRKATGDRPIALAWFSPDCKHFSKAKGSKPVEKKIRDLAWVVVRWAKVKRPAVIMLENVEEFRDWGPLITTEDGRQVPCPASKGLTFRRWQRALESLGYAVEARELRACDYGAPTVRKRLFVIARCDGRPISWPAPTHARDGAGGLLPWRSAAECIDWNHPTPSIFGRDRDLAENTLRRIARGVIRFVVEAPNPFIVPVTHTGDGRVHDLADPLRTITTAKGGEYALAVPHVTKFRQNSIGHDARAPLATVTANGFNKRPGGAVPLGVVSAFLSHCYTSNTTGGQGDLFQPAKTITAGGTHHALAAAYLAQQNTGMVGHDARSPVSTIVGKGCTQTPIVCRMSDEDRAGAERVAAFLVKYYGTSADGQAAGDPLHAITSKARFGLVLCRGVPIVDIGLRMLQPRELFNAQSFPRSYIIDRGPLGAPLTKVAQIRMCGNSVPPVMAEALVRSNIVETGVDLERARLAA